MFYYIIHTLIDTIRIRMNPNQSPFNILKDSYDLRVWLQARQAHKTGRGGVYHKDVQAPAASDMPRLARQDPYQTPCAQVTAVGYCAHGTNCPYVHKHKSFQTDRAVNYLLGEVRCMSDAIDELKELNYCILATVLKQGQINIDALPKNRLEF